VSFFKRALAPRFPNSTAAAFLRLATLPSVVHFTH
jgi:hypothetical protein